MCVRVVMRLVLAAGLGLAVAKGAAAEAGGKALRVTFVDVEGGQATLFVTPEGGSLLVDAGWPGNEGRDADRILKAAKQAGLSRIDTVLLTHYHDDHVGGVPQLVARIPVGTFVDHGPNRELDHGDVEGNYAAYLAVLAKPGLDGRVSAHRVVKPGDLIAVAGLRVTVVSADGVVLAQPLTGAGAANPYCAASEVRPPDQTENARSTGVVIEYGRLRMVDLGDLTWDKERDLMCPVNRLGQADVLVVSHHGWYQSSSPALVEAVHPRVAVMDNGAKKGGSAGTFETLAKATGPNGRPTVLWQLHTSEEAGPLNTAVERIANPPGVDGRELVMEGWRDGRVKIAVSR